MPMSPRLLRPVASGVHPEAAAWRSAVVANGGSVSATTMRAVSKFCADIDAAGIRDRFYRLNLFCGTGLNAALVPLYRGQSRTGTQFGNTTETNNGPFVSGDYSETSGLFPGATNATKWLNTGFPGNTITTSGLHFGVGILAAGTQSGNRDVIGAWDGSSNALMIRIRSVDTTFRAACFSRFGTLTDQFGDNVGTTGAHLAAGNIVASYPTMYRDGAATGTDATTSANFTSDRTLGVFALNSAQNGVFSHSNPRLGWYSIGGLMTLSQVQSFNTAINSFYTAIGRT